MNRESKEGKWKTSSKPIKETIDKSKLKEELKWLKETPFWIGKDGIVSFPMILFLLFTGVITGIIIVLVYKYYRIWKIKKLLNE